MRTGIDAIQGNSKEEDRRRYRGDSTTNMHERSKVYEDPVTRFGIDVLRMVAAQNRFPATITGLV
jgi:hypothetical protein